LINANPRTQARANGSAGNSGGSGYASSRYSRIANDWKKLDGAVDQSRHHHLRIDRPVCGGKLVAFFEMQKTVFPRDALQVQRDAHAKRAWER